MSEEEELIQLEALGYDNWTNFRMVCPFCCAKHEKSLQVFVNLGSTTYICYRAKCKSSGYIGGKRPARKKKKFTAKFIKEDMVYIPKHILTYLRQKYQLHPLLIQENRFKYIPATSSLYMPLLDKHLQVWGGCSKKLIEEKFKPKTLTYLHTDTTTRLHYPPPLDSSPTFCDENLVVVEDVLSAVKMSHFSPSVALLGTHMSEEQAVELSQSGKSIILFLDHDAVEIASKIRRKYSALFPCKIIVHPQDPKDTDMDKLQKLFNSVRN